MALTESNMLPLKTEATDFSLIDSISQKQIRWEDIKGLNGTLVIFMCNHCPYVIHLIKEIVTLGKECQDKNIGVVAISSNDIVNYPEDSPEKMKILAAELAFSFPYLYDESQEIAKSYDAACTPDFYLYDPHDLLVYRGRFDDSRPSLDIPVTGKDLRFAIENMLAGNPPLAFQRPSAGCNIKWKK